MTNTSKPNFTESLREADESLRAYGVPSSTERRLRTRLIHGKSKPSQLLRWSLATGAACAAALLFLLLRSSGDAQEPQTFAAGFSLTSAGEDLRYSLNADNSITIESDASEAVLAELGLLLKNSGPVTVKSRNDGVRLIQGTATFSVAKRTPGQAPVRVWVSHGRIEVIGTEFTVEQKTANGSVVLREGTIRFVAESGQTSTLSAGESLAWPLPKASGREPLGPKLEEAVPVPDSDRKPSTRPENATADSPEAAPTNEEPKKDILDELAKLRSRGEYAEAADLLRESLSGADLNQTAREQLSYELGTILTYTRLKNNVTACNHWTGHSQRFPAGRYAAEVESAMSRLSCGEGRE
jgi:transmembrane sensor